MKPLRVPVAGLMALVLACGLAFAAFRSLSDQAANMAFAAMWLALLASVVAAKFGRHPVFWKGFAIVGGVYAALAFAPGAEADVRPYLATSALLEEVADRLELPKRPGWYRFGPRAMSLTRTRQTVFPALGMLDLGDRYNRIGHSVAAIAHGIAGGILAAVVAARGRRREEEA